MRQPKQRRRHTDHLPTILDGNDNEDDVAVIMNRNDTRGSLNFRFGFGSLVRNFQRKSSSTTNTKEVQPSSPQSSNPNNATGNMSRGDTMVDSRRDDESYPSEPAVGAGGKPSFHDDDGNDVRNDLSPSPLSSLSGLQVTLLVVNPRTNHFEFVRLEFFETSCHVDQILSCIPASVAQAEFRTMEYEGIVDVRRNPNALLRRYREVGDGGGSSNSKGPIVVGNESGGGGDNGGLLLVAVPTNSTFKACMDQVFQILSMKEVSYLVRVL